MDEERSIPWYIKLYIYVVFTLQVVDLVLIALAYKVDTDANKVVGVLIAMLLLLVCATVFLLYPTAPSIIGVMIIATVTTALSILTHVLKDNKVLWVLTLLCRSLALIATGVMGTILVTVTAPEAPLISV